MLVPFYAHVVHFDRTVEYWKQNQNPAQNSFCFSIHSKSFNLRFSNALQNPLNKNNIAWPGVFHHIQRILPVTAVSSLCSFLQRSTNSALHMSLDNALTNQIGRRLHHPELVRVVSDLTPWCLLEPHVIALYKHNLHFWPNDNVVFHRVLLAVVEQRRRDAVLEIFDGVEKFLHIECERSSPATNGFGRVVHLGQFASVVVVAVLGQCLGCDVAVFQNLHQLVHQCQLACTRNSCNCNHHFPLLCIEKTTDPGNERTEIGAVDMNAHLPNAWKCTEIAGADYMYGFCASAPYLVYVTDLTKVWVDAPACEKVQKMAVAAGITNFDEAKLRYLVGQLEAQVDSFEMRKVSDSVISAHTTVADGLKWTFSLELAVPEDAAEFFRKLSLVQFANHSFLLYKVAQLEAIIRARDKYTLYLEENYKTINGSELMNKYRRQHLDETELLQKFNKEQCDTRIRSQYQKRNARTTWNSVSIVVKDTSTWTVSASEPVPELVKLELVKSEPVKSESVKSEPVKKEPKKSPRTRVGHLSRKRPRLDAKELSPESVSPKRKRIGMPGRR